MQGKWVAIWAGAAVAALVLSSVPAQAQVGAPQDWHGVWRGTIGTLPVQACLPSRGESWGNGSYYYLSKLEPIRLELSNDGGTWTELAGDRNSDTGSWRLRVDSENRLSGEWRQGDKVLPIQLSRVGVDGEISRPCGSEAYMAPRLKPVRLVATQATNNGIAYRSLGYALPAHFSEVEIALPQIPETRPGDRAINARFRKELEPGQDNVDYADCMSGAIMMSGNDGEFHRIGVPVLATPDWLVIKHSMADTCGGAYPNSYQMHRTFDRRTGAEVKLGAWFTRKGMAPMDGDMAIGSDLRDLIIRTATFDSPDCRESFEMQDYWDLELTRQGINFTPQLPHVVQACANPTLMSFASLAPFLNVQGKQAIARMSRGGR